MTVKSDEEKGSQIMKTLSLRTNFSWKLVGNVILTISQWGILVVLAKIGTPHMVGQFTFGLAVTAPIIFFTNMSLSKILSTDPNNTYEFRDYLGLRLMSNVFAILCISIMLSLIGIDLQFIFIVMMIGLSKVVEATSNIFHGLYQKHERMDYIGLSYMIKGPVSLIAMGICLWMTNSLLIGVTALTGCWLLILVVYEFRLGRRFASIKPRFNLAKFRHLTMLSLPMGIVALLLSIIPNVPRYFIEYYLGSEALGYFASVVYIMVAFNTFVNALGETIVPRLAKYYASQQKKEYGRLIWNVIFMVIGMSIGALCVIFFFGQHLLTLLYNSDYALYNEVLFQLMIAALIIGMSSMLEYGITAARKFQIQMVLFMLVFIVNIILAYVLIPRFGLIGAAYSITFSAIFQLFGSFVIFMLVIYKLRVSLQEVQEEHRGMDAVIENANS